jgi:protein-arginine kinase activator protein McsA
MICYICESREATIARTEVVSDDKTIIYRCESCANGQKPEPAKNPALSLDRPCEKCRKAEGEVKLTRFINGRRVAIFICQECARS